MIPQGGQLAISSTKLTKRGKAILSRFETPKLFLTQFNPDYCLNRYLGFKTPHEAILSNTIKLNELSQTYGEQTIVRWIRLWIVNLSKFMDFSVDDMQCKRTAILILEGGYMLNMAELTLFFKRIMNGHYGEFYGKFNPQQVLRPLREYRTERGRVILKMSDDEQKKI